MSTGPSPAREGTAREGLRPLRTPDPGNSPLPPITPPAPFSASRELRA